MRRPLLPIIVAGCLVAVPAAFADDRDDDHDRRIGRLDLTGSGTVVAEGRFVSYGLVQGPGVLTATDRGGQDVRVRVVLYPGPRRRPVVRDGRRVVVTRGYARFVVSGSRFQVRLTGRALAISIAGSAAARLRGEGTYTLDDREPRAWDPMERIILGDGPVARAERREPRPAPES